MYEDILIDVISDEYVLGCFKLVLRTTYLDTLIFYCIFKYMDIDCSVLMYFNME